MKVLLLAGYYLPGYKAGGPIKTISNLIDATFDNVDYCVITSDRDLGDEHPYSNVSIGQWNDIGNCLVFYAENGIKGLIQLQKIMSSKDYDIVYLNSFFSVRFSLIPLILAKFYKKPTVLGPRGEFSDGALSLKAFKKKSIYTALITLLSQGLWITF